MLHPPNYLKHNCIDEPFVSCFNNSSNNYHFFNRFFFYDQVYKGEVLYTGYLSGIK